MVKNTATQEDIQAAKNIMKSDLEDQLAHSKYWLAKTYKYLEIGREELDNAVKEVESLKKAIQASKVMLETLNAVEKQKIQVGVDRLHKLFDEATDRVKRRQDSISSRDTDPLNFVMGHPTGEYYLVGRLLMLRKEIQNYEEALKALE